MKIGDRLHCENGKVYTLAEATKVETIWDTTYDFSLVDENGNVIDEVTEYHLSRCLVNDSEEKRSLAVGFDKEGFLIRTKVRHLEVV